MRPVNCLQAAFVWVTHETSLSHAFLSHVWHHLIHAFRQLWQMIARHGWEGVVFHMKQQMGSGKIQPRAALGAGNVVFTIAAMVHAPHRKETDQTTAHQHGSHMVNQQRVLADGSEQ